jgi:hypothetical protein
MEIMIRNLKSQPEILEKMRQELARIELKDPHPDQDCDGHENDVTPSCLTKLANGKYRSSGDKINDFRESFSYKFLTNEEELNRYRHNDEKDDTYYNDRI